MADHIDERIRALLARAVAQAPPPPSAEHVMPIVLDRSDRSNGSGPLPGHDRDHRPADRRGVLAAAAGIAAVALALIGTFTVGDGNGDVGAGDPREAAVFQDNLVRYVPTELPAGAHLARIEDSVAAVVDRSPPSRVSVFEGPGGEQVRVVVDPPNTTVVGGAATTTPPTSVDPTRMTSVATSDTAPPTTLGTTTPTTPSSPPGIPVRAGQQPTPVRGATGVIEQHGAAATTVWFVDGGVAVAVDVFGADATSALRIVEGLTRRPDGGFDPAPAEQLVSVVDEPPGSTDDPRPATTRLVYAAHDPVGSETLSVTTTGLEPGRHDLLAATAGWFGYLDQWDEREVFVHDRPADLPPGIEASFVDPAGVLVTVWATTTTKARSYVDSLDAADARSWRMLRDEESERVAGLPASIPADLGDATITEHRRDGSDGGYCLEVEGERACRPSSAVDATEDLAPRATVQGWAAHVLVDGRWWYFGYSADRAGLVAVTPDRGDAEIHSVTIDGTNWFAVVLPDTASATSIEFRTAAGAAVDVSTARPAS